MSLGLFVLALLAVATVAWAHATGNCCSRACFCDSAGSDDEGGGQKDLNKM